MIDRVQELPDRVFLGGRSQVISRDVQIDLRAGDLLVTEKIAYGDQVDSGLHEMRCERVAQSMRRHSLRDPGAMPPGANALVDRTARHAIASTTAKERRTGDGGSTIMSVRGHGGDDPFVERQAAFMTAFADHGDRTGIEVDVSFGERRTLRYADAGAVEQREDRAIAQAQNGIVGRQRQQLLNLLVGVRHRQLLTCCLDRRECGHRVVWRVEIPHGDHRPVEVLQDGNGAVDGAVAVLAHVAKVLHVLQDIARGDRVGCLVVERNAHVLLKLTKCGIVRRDRLRAQSACGAVHLCVELDPVRPHHVRLLLPVG